jgi:hypothetical protein
MNKPVQQKQTQQKAPPQQQRRETQAIKPGEIVKIENRGALVTTNVPEYLKQEGAALGVEHMRPSDILLARFQLAQETTRAAKKQNTERYIEGLEPGLFYNTLTKQVFGNEVLFIPLLKWPKRARMPEEFTGGGGPLCRSEDGKTGEGDPGGNCRTCMYAKWVDDQPPLCSDVMTYHILPLPERDYVPTQEDWCVWGARKSAINAAKMLNRLYLMRQGALDLFKCVFKISSFWDTKQTQPCWVPKIDNAEWVTPDQYTFARAFFHSVHNLERAGSIHVSDIVDEDAINVEATTEPGADVAPF